MQKKSKWIVFTALSLSVLLLSGCYSAYRAVSDKRSLDTQVDDAKRASNIKYALLADDSIKGLDISVSVYYGTAYLVGVVENDLQKDIAMAHARAETGIDAVKTYLLNRNDKTLGQSVDDAALAAKIRTRMIQEKGLNSSQVKVKSVLGHVALLGVVDNVWARDVSIAIARSVQGVKQVKSFIIVK